jgi:pimeloyl-ACP methyl ester carboxylesterase
MTEQPGSGFTRGTVSAGEFTLDYIESGPPNAAITVVSFPGSAGLETSVAKDILAQSVRVVEINPPGWGGKDDLAREMDMSECGRILAEAANKLVEGQYFIIGTSMGGANAIHAAALQPERVRGLILEGSMAPSAPEDLRMPPPVPPGSESDQTPPPATDSAEAPAYPLPPFNPKKPWATDDYVREQMANRFKMTRWVKPELLPEAALATVRERRVPVLALLGDEDEILAPSQKGTLSESLPEAGFILIAGGSHDLQNTAADQFVAAAKQFIEAVD